MKSKFFLWIAVFMIMMLCIPLTACSQTRILSDLPSGNGVEKVFVNKAMINMGGQMVGDMMGVYRDMIGDVEGVEVYSCSNSSLISSAKTQMEEILKKYKAEILVESEENGETSNIYTLYREKNKENPIGLAIIESDGNNINIVIIHGSFEALIKQPE